MKLGEYGVVFRFNASFDLRNFTGLELTFTKPDETTLVVTDLDGVTVGTVNVETANGEFLAYQYTLYTFEDGDLDQSGDWSVFLTYDGPGPQHLISDSFVFKVDNPDC